MKKLANLFLLSLFGFSLPVYAQLNCDSTCVTPQTINFPKTKTVTSTKTLPGQITFGSQCGAAAGSVVTSAPSSFLCSNGTPSPVNTVNNAGDISYTWTCTIPSGASTSCAAFQREVGTCGADNGTTVPSDPVNLCATGSSSSLSLVGLIYTWKCNGNYGSPASCSANLTPPPPPYTFGSVVYSILSCDELNAISGGNMTNPNNPPGSKRVVNGVVLAIADSSGWFALPFNFYGLSGFGGAFAWRQPAYLDGVFHHWVGFSDTTSNQTQGGWNMSQVGLCQGRFNWDEMP